MIARLLNAGVAARFVSVGIINTLFGYAIMLAGLAAGLGDIAANAAGYVLGFGFSYLMHYRFTYRQNGHGRSPLLYLLAVAASYLVNLAIVLIGRDGLGLVENPLVHLAAICGYAVALYCLSTAFAFRTESTAPARSLSTFWPELATGLVWLGALALSGLISVQMDVSWQLWIGRHMNAGVPLYDWIMEANPPLWFWMAQPVSALAARFALRPEHVDVIFVLLQIGVALALVAVLVRDWPARHRAVLLAGMAGAMLLVMINDFAQREHQALIGILPYAVLTARRGEGRSVPWPLALAVGVLAAPMIALKHYFALLPIGLELWLLVQRRGWRHIPRPETLCLGLGAICYGAAIAVFTPAYLSDLVPMLSATYGELNDQNGMRMVYNRLVLLLVPSAFFFWHYRATLSRVTQAMLIVAAGFSVAFFLQGKGWDYHQSPAIAALFVAVVLQIGIRVGQEARIDWKGKVMAGLIMVVALALPLAKGPYKNSYEAQVSAFLEPVAPGSSVVPMLTHPSFVWPMVLDRNYRLVSRYYHYWMLPAIARPLMRGETLDARRQGILDRVRRETVEDFLCNPPDALIVDTRSVDDQAFDLPGLFAENPAFAAIFAAYAKTGTLGRLELYQRQRSLPPAQADMPCMPIGAGREPPAMP